MNFKPEHRVGNPVINNLNCTHVSYRGLSVYTNMHSQILHSAIKETTKKRDISTIVDYKIVGTNYFNMSMYCMYS